MNSLLTLSGDTFQQPAADSCPVMRLDGGFALTASETITSMSAEKFISAGSLSNVPTGADKAMLNFFADIKLFHDKT